jgi:hypothetical protein
MLGKHGLKVMVSAEDSVVSIDIDGSPFYRTKK